jgi:hypothetical protein
MTRTTTTLLTLVLLSGCSAFTPPKGKPVIEDRISSHWSRKTVGVLATTPERRVFLAKMPEQKFCAEPPADAADNVAYALSAAAGVSGKGKVTELQASLAQSAATSVNQLFVRSQGLQIYRDGNFMLCTAFLNGVVKEKEFMDRQTELLKVSRELIAQEIPFLYQWKQDSAEKANPGRPADKGTEHTGIHATADVTETVKSHATIPSAEAEAVAGKPVLKKAAVEKTSAE